MKLKIAPKKVAYTYSPFVDGVTQSMLALQMECQEKARLAIILGLTESTPSKPLIFGAISHEILDQYYNGIRSGKIKTHAHAVASTSAFVDHACETWHKQNPRASVDAQEIVEDSAGILTVLFPEYAAHWHDDDHSYEWLKIEEKFRVEVDVFGSAKPAILTGKIDALICEKKTGIIRLFETKNKSQMNDMLGLILPMDLQIGTYMTATQALMPDETIDHAMYNLLKRPGERQGKKEDRKGFLKRLGEKVRENRKDYFERFRMKFDAKEIEQHKFATELKIQKFVDWWIEESKRVGDNRSLMWNGGACENKYGVCKFIHACASNDRSKFFVRPKAHAEL